MVAARIYRLSGLLIPLQLGLNIIDRLLRRPLGPDLELELPLESFFFALQLQANFPVRI